MTLAARTKSEVDAAAEAIRARGDKAEALVLDVTDADAVRAAFDAAEAFEILVNNAGTNRPAPFLDVKIEDFDGSFGGPIIKDKLWFMLTGRDQVTFTQAQGSFYPNGAPFG